jgi:hypothetical protein
MCGGALRRQMSDSHPCRGMRVLLEESDILRLALRAHISGQRGSLGGRYLDRISTLFALVVSLRTS